MPCVLWVKPTAITRRHLKKSPFFTHKEYSVKSACLVWISALHATEYWCPWQNQCDIPNTFLLVFKIPSVVSALHYIHHSAHLLNFYYIHIWSKILLKELFISFSQKLFIKSTEKTNTSLFNDHIVKHSQIWQFRSNVLSGLSDNIPDP